MKLRELHIENFRGIRDLRLQLGDTTVLIGENNSGKTAVLAAIERALHGVRSRKGMAFEAYDFHLPDGACEPSGSEPIRITLSFREDEPDQWDDTVVRTLRGVIQLRGELREVTLRVTAHYDAITRDFAQDWSFLDLEGNPLPPSSRALEVLRERVPFFYLSALRDASRHFNARGEYWRHFLKDGQLTDDQRQEIEAKLQELNAMVIGAHATFEQVRTALTSIQEVVPVAGGDLVSIDAVPGRVFDMLSRAEVSLSAPTGARIPVGRHGEGTQSLAVLMLFKAFLAATADSATPLIALEEPEAHLHPAAVRSLWHLLEALPGQKIITTHSGDLLAEVPVSAVQRLVRTDAGVDRFLLRDDTLSGPETHKLDFHIRQHRGELLFARWWILVEGETEMILLPALARHLGCDLEQSGVRCVPYRHADIELFLKVASDLGINWSLLCDSDPQGESDRQKVNARLAGRPVSDVLTAMPEDDIEHHLCACGFGHIYEKYLTDQVRDRVTAAPEAPEYWSQVTKAIKNVRHYSKPAAALEVMAEIRAGAAIPIKLGQCIHRATEGAKD